MNSDDIEYLEEFLQHLQDSISYETESPCVDVITTPVVIKYLISLIEEKLPLLKTFS